MQEGITLRMHSGTLRGAAGFYYHLAYKQLSIEQQRVVWFVGGSSMVNGGHPVWKVEHFRPANGKTLIEEVKTDLLGRLICIAVS